MNISDFIDLIEAHDYMADNQIASIRRQLSTGTLDMSIEELVRFLLEKQRLTKYQAKKLLAEARSGVTADSLPVSDARRRAQEKWVSADPVEDEIAEIGADDMVALDDFPTSEGGLGGDPFGLGGADEAASEDDPFGEKGDGEPEDKKKKGHKKKTSRANPWDSPLLLIGGSSLILMLLVGALLYFWLAFDSGDEMFQAAEKSYRGGSYVQAAAEYDKFIKRFPDHPSAPLAEVRLGMAALWNAVEGGSNWESALTTTQTVLPEINQLPAFEEARPELASILPEIATGLAENAQKSGAVDEKERLANLADEAMALVNDPVYMPTSMRETQQQKIETIAMNLVRVRRDVDRDRARNEALTQIEANTASGKFQEVYQLRRTLLDSYPALRTDEGLVAAVSKAAMTLADQVKPIETFPMAIAGDADMANPLAQVTYVQREPMLPASEDSEVVTFRLDGAAYAIELDSGRMLWRRYVGMAENAQAVSWVADDGQPMVALIDAAEGQLVAINARTGKVAWRQEFASTLFRPKVFENALLAVEADGKVWKLSKETGEVMKAVQLPQKVSAPLGMLADVSAVFAVAEHSNLFVLSPDDLSCTEVVPIGHETGAIPVEPTGTLRHLFLFENAGLEYSFVHVFNVNAAGGEATLVQDVVRQSGQILVPPIISDSRLIATNDRGEVLVYEVNTAAKEVPARLVAATKSDSSEPIIGFAAVDRGMLWVCGRRMTRYVMQLSRGSVVRKMVDHDGDTFVAPPLIRGDQIISARRNPDADGFVVQAQRIGGNRLDKIWKTTVGAPTAGKAFELKGAPTPLVVTTRGSVFPLPKGKLGSIEILDNPELKLDVTTQNYQFASGDKVDDTTHVFYPPDGQNRALTIGMGGGKVISRIVSWEIPVTPRATVPSVWNQQVLVPTKMGQIMVVDPKTGAADVQPFQPKLEFGELIQWSSPANVAGSVPSVVLSDGKARMFRLGVETSPEPYLTALDQIELEEPMSGPIAAAGLMLVGVGAKDGQEYLRLFQLPELAEQEPIAIAGDVVWAPHAADGRVYCATSEDGLVAIRDDFSVAWKCPLEGRTIASTPIMVGNMLAVSFSQGELWLIDAETGQPTSQFDIGEPLGEGISYFNGELWAHGYDGTLHGIPVEDLIQ
ncbi:PQQ-binding-like beta-propeller repeat protein [Bremerella cremea]|uniref:outer membrane protein assembly factor BamB family protein n=1 Tax=Bremerella cremea TaxID=1031537 RepID=UPI0031ECA9DE